MSSDPPKKEFTPNPQWAARRAKLRTVRGQLTLIGALYLGAILLSIVALGLRSPVFERYARDKYPELTEPIRAIVEEAKAGSITLERVKKLAPTEIESVFGAWIADPQFDPSGQVAVRLLLAAPDDLVTLVRRVCAIGNLEQRRGTVRLLEVLVRSHVPLPADLRVLGRHLHDRAAKRGEHEFSEQVAAILGPLERTAVMIPSPIPSSSSTLP